MPLRREEGQTTAEYGVVLGVIVIVTVAAYIALGDGVTALVERVIARI